MKKITIIRNKQRLFFSYCIITALVMLTVFSVFCQAMAKDESGRGVPQDTSWHPGNAKNVNDYFRGKYKFDAIGWVHSTVRETKYGPKGRLDVVGVEIRPENPVAISGEYGQARGIARTFLETEAEVLGITNMEEIREYEVIPSDNRIFINVFYHEYIGNLELAIGRMDPVAARIHVAVGPNNTITDFDADLVAVPPEAYAAASIETLPDSRIREIVELDLKTNKISPREWHEGEFKKYVIPEPPYVVFKVGNVWLYTIDAFSGEILKKGAGRIIK